MSSLMVVTEKYLLGKGYTHNIFCGLTAMWAYCKVCQSYSQQYPISKGWDAIYICSECKSHSTRII